MTVVGVLGLGKLGLPFALTLEQAGHEVFAYDVDAHVRKTVTQRKSHLQEPYVQEMLDASQMQIVAPRVMSDFVEVVFIIVPTPSLPISQLSATGKNTSGSFDSSLVREAIMSLRDNNRNRVKPVVAVVSTVSPGTCRSVLAPTAKAFDMELVYSPTMIALGTVVRDLRHPQAQVIGTGTTPEAKAAASKVSEVMQSFAPDAPYAFMSYVSAEITKLSANVFTTLKIDFANLLGRMCADYPGADVDDITSALGLNAIIGPKALTAGAGYGGPCFPRDAFAFSAAGGSLGAVVHALNSEHAQWIVHYAYEAARVLPETFVVLGRGYKEESNYRIESFGDKLADLFTARGLIEVTTSTADIVVIAQQLRDHVFEHFEKDAVVFDLWRTHGYLKARKDIKYIPFGINDDRSEDDQAV